MRKLLLAAVISSALAGAQAFAKPEHGPQRPLFDDMDMIHTLHKLDLTKAQRKSLRQLVREFHDTQDDNDMKRGDRKRFKEAPAPFETLTSEDIASAAASRWEETKTRRLAVASLKHDMWLLLTDEQKAALESINLEREAAMAERKANREERERPVPFSELALSDEQTSTITSLMEAQKANDEETRASMKSLHEKEMMLIQQDILDETALSTLYDSYEDVVVAQAVGRAQTQAKLLAVLTDEQREELTEIRELEGPKRGKRGDRDRHHHPMS